MWTSINPGFLLSLTSHIFSWEVIQVLGSLTCQLTSQGRSSVLCWGFNFLGVPQCYCWPFKDHCTCCWGLLSWYPLPSSIRSWHLWIHICNWAVSVSSGSPSTYPSPDQDIRTLVHKLWRVCVLSSVYWSNASSSISDPWSREVTCCPDMGPPQRA
jgi:hypothetical protein